MIYTNPFPQQEYSDLALCYTALYNAHFPYLIWYNDMMLLVAQ